MKKVLFVILTCLMSFNVKAQAPKEHLKFMGIEMKGSISNFQAKLLEKGLKVSSQSKQQPTGIRTFDGAFSGEDAQICVWYNPRTKDVYRAKAIIKRYGKDMIEQLIRTMEIKLDAKYGTEHKKSEEVKDDHLHSFRQYTYLTENGTIDLFIVSSSYSDQSVFSLHIDYTDTENYKKNTQDEMDDL